MARRRRSGLKQPHKIAQLIRAAAGNTADAERELADGNCGEAVRAITHAYALRGEAMGYASALRTAKGRSGSTSTSVLVDPRLDRMGRTRIKIAKLCGRSR
jgi:hypothetical protein